MEWRVVKVLVLLIVLVPTCVYGANSVIIESKTLEPGSQSVYVGVYVNNDNNLAGFTLPLEFRTISGGAFVSATPSMYLSGKLSVSPAALQSRPTPGGSSCSGPTASSFPTPNGAFDLVSPDALYRAWISGGTAVAAGQDGSPGSGTPSMLLLIDLDCDSGSFVIDTCCFTPNHLLFTPTSGPSITPSFTSGTITIEPFAACICNDHPTDNDCNGYTDIIDVVRCRNVAFSGYPEYPPCCIDE